VDETQERHPIVEVGPPVREAPPGIRSAAAAAVGALRLLGQTWSLQWTRRHLIDRWGGGGLIFAFWHGESLVPAWAYRKSGVAVMVSLHKDGEIMNRALSLLGFRRVRGSTTRGGRAAMSAMIELLRHGGTGAITPDGPRGPRHTVHPGVLLLAARTGKPILPCGIAARPCWRLRSWDHYMIPWPFARIRIAAGDPLIVPAELDRTAMAGLGDELAGRIRRLTAEVEFA